VPATEQPVIAIVDESADAYVQLLQPHFPGASFVGATDFDSLPGPGFVAKALITFGLTLAADQFAKFDRLTWVQALSTGVDHLLPLVRGRDIALTSARGIHGAAVSELALLLMLALARGLPRMIRAQARHEWQGFDGALLAGKSVGIIGLGLISAELARKCDAFGMSVTAFTATPRDVPHVDRMRSYEELADIIGELDFLVSVAPLNERSRRMIDEPLLARAKPGLLFVNVGRGGTVEEEALVAALRDGRLGGAGLDTVELEPLDPASPFWDMENVILTPHVAGRGDSYVDRVSGLLVENIAAFLAGRPLTNRVEATAASAGAPPRTR
jgi:D-2-hydroxyacid dehydrogenase (NADP+)